MKGMDIAMGLQSFYQRNQPSHYLGIILYLIEYLKSEYELNHTTSV